jgi:hypothetical protein
MQLESVSKPVIAAGPKKVRVPGGWRYIFTFPVVMGALLMLVMALTVRQRFSDPDLWWHLKTGEIMWNKHSIARADLFSLTAQGHPSSARAYPDKCSMSMFSAVI